MSQRLKAVRQKEKTGRQSMLRKIMGVFAALGVVAAMPVAAQQSAGPRVPLGARRYAGSRCAGAVQGVAHARDRAAQLAPRLSNAPKLARATLAAAQALRYDAVVSRSDKELIILRATQLARGDYQFGQHVRLAISCGITAEQIESLPRWRDSKLFSDRQRAVLAFADAMVSPEGVDDATFDAMKSVLQQPGNRRTDDERRLSTAPTRKSAARSASPRKETRRAAATGRASNWRSGHFVAADLHFSYGGG